MNQRIIQLLLLGIIALIALFILGFVIIQIIKEIKRRNTNISYKLPNLDKINKKKKTKSVFKISKKKDLKIKDVKNINVNAIIKNVDKNKVTQKNLDLFEELDKQFSAPVKKSLIHLPTEILETEVEENLPKKQKIKLELSGYTKPLTADFYDMLEEMEIDEIVVK